MTTYRQLPQYAAGGAVGPGGMPLPPPPQAPAAGVAPQGASAPMNLEAEVQRFAQQHPEQVEEIKEAIMQLMQSGELTPQELNTLAQLSQLAMQNPEMYPKVRQFAIQEGLATEQDMPAEYNQGVVFMLLLAAKSVRQEGGVQAPAAPGATPSPVASMAGGGPVPQSRKKSGGVVIEAHEGEYVIPKYVVEMKGREFFDSLVEKYRPGGEQE